MTTTTWPILTNIEMRSSKSQKWNTAIEQVGSGRKRSNTNQLMPLWTISVKFWKLSEADYKTIMGFVALRKGAHEPFYWLDPDDYQETAVTLPKISSGKYQCVMKFGGYIEAVEKVDQLTVYVNGTEQAASGYSESNGVITFATAPASDATVTATYRYYWKVHLPADGITMNHIFTDFKQTGTLKFESWR